MDKIKTPVFEVLNGKILGFLEHDRRPQNNFAVRCLPVPGTWPTLADWKPHDVRHNRRDEAHLWPKIEIVQFEWGVLGSSRNEAECWYCDVLLTADVALVGRLPGFKWFAEEYGQKAQCVAHG